MLALKSATSLLLHITLFLLQKIEMKKAQRAKQRMHCFVNSKKIELLKQQIIACSKQKQLIISIITDAKESTLQLSLILCNAIYCDVCRRNLLYLFTNHISGGHFGVDQVWLPPMLAGTKAFSLKTIFKQ